MMIRNLRITSAVLVLILSSAAGCRYPHGLAERFVAPRNLSSLRIISPLENSQITVPDVPKLPVDADAVTSSSQEGDSGRPSNIERSADSERADVTEGNRRICLGRRLAGRRIALRQFVICVRPGITDG